METFSALLATCAGNSPVPGEFPAQRPVMRSFDVFFNLCLNKRLSKQWRGWWFETLSRPLWRQRNVISCTAGGGIYIIKNRVKRNRIHILWARLIRSFLEHFYIFVVHIKGKMYFLLLFMPAEYNWKCFQQTHILFLYWHIMIPFEWSPVDTDTILIFPGK